MRRQKILADAIGVGSQPHVILSVPNTEAEELQPSHRWTARLRLNSNWERAEFSARHRALGPSLLISGKILQHLLAVLRVVMSLSSQPVCRLIILIEHIMTSAVAFDAMSTIYDKERQLYGLAVLWRSERKESHILR